MRLHVHIGPRSRAKPSKKSATSSVCRSPTRRARHLGVDREGGAPTQVHRRDRQRLIHRHHKIPGTQNAAACRQALDRRPRPARCPHPPPCGADPHRDRPCIELEVETAVPREQLQHVIEEANARGNLVVPFALDGQLDGDARLRGLAIDHRRACGRHRVTSFSLARWSSRLLSFAMPPKSRSAPLPRLLICSRVPMVMRTQPSHPGSSERSRTSTPRALACAAQTRMCSRPISTRMKFA